MNTPEGAARDTDPARRAVLRRVGWAVLVVVAACIILPPLAINTLGTSASPTFSVVGGPPIQPQPPAQMK